MPRTKQQRPRHILGSPIDSNTELGEKATTMSSDENDNLLPSPNIKSSSKESSAETLTSWFSPHIGREIDHLACGTRRPATSAELGEATRKLSDTSPDFRDNSEEVETKQKSEESSSDSPNSHPQQTECAMVSSSNTTYLDYLLFKRLISQTNGNPRPAKMLTESDMEKNENADGTVHEQKIYSAEDRKKLHDLGMFSDTENISNDPQLKVMWRNLMLNPLPLMIKLLMQSQKLNNSRTDEGAQKTGSELKLETFFKAVADENKRASDKNDIQKDDVDRIDQRSGGCNATDLDRENVESEKKTGSVTRRDTNTHAISGSELGKFALHNMDKPGENAGSSDEGIEKPGIKHENVEEAGRPTPDIFKRKYDTMNSSYEYPSIPYLPVHGIRHPFLSSTFPLLTREGALPDMASDLSEASRRATKVREKKLSGSASVTSPLSPVTQRSGRSVPEAFHKNASPYHQSDPFHVGKAKTQAHLSPTIPFWPHGTQGSSQRLCRDVAHGSLTQHSFPSSNQVGAYKSFSGVPPPSLPLSLVPFRSFSGIPTPTYFNPWPLAYPPMKMDQIIPGPFPTNHSRTSLTNRHSESPASSSSPSRPRSAHSHLYQSSSKSKSKIPASNQTESFHAAIVQRAKEMNKGLDPENMYIECPICHKRIKRLYHFQRHMRIHSGEKNHKCDYCQYKSVRKDNLKSHMKTHEKSKHESKRAPTRKDGSGQISYPQSPNYHRHSGVPEYNHISPSMLRSPSNSLSPLSSTGLGTQLFPYGTGQIGSRSVTPESYCGNLFENSAHPRKFRRKSLLQSSNAYNEHLMKQNMLHGPFTGIPPFLQVPALNMAQPPTRSDNELSPGRITELTNEELEKKHEQTRMKETPISEYPRRGDFVETVSTGRYKDVFKPINMHSKHKRSSGLEMDTIPITAEVRKRSDQPLDDSISDNKKRPRLSTDDITFDGLPELAHAKFRPNANNSNNQESATCKPIIVSQDAFSRCPESSPFEANDCTDDSKRQVKQRKENDAAIGGYAGKLEFLRWNQDSSSTSEKSLYGLYPHLPSKLEDIEFSMDLNEREPRTVNSNLPTKDDRNIVYLNSPATGFPQINRESGEKFNTHGNSKESERVSPLPIPTEIRGAYLTPTQNGSTGSDVTLDHLGENRNTVEDKDKTDFGDTGARRKLSHSMDDPADGNLSPNEQEDKEITPTASPQTTSALEQESLASSLSEDSVTYCTEHGRLDVISKNVLSSAGSSGKASYIRDQEEKGDTERELLPITSASDFSVRCIVQPRFSVTNRGFKCRLCDYSAPSNSSLQEHMNIHKEDGLYKCQQCDYHGKNLSKLIEHIRIHTGERPFQCDQCDYAAKRKDNLAQHKSVRHDKNRYKGPARVLKFSDIPESTDGHVSKLDISDNASKYRNQQGRQSDYRTIPLPAANHFSDITVNGSCAVSPSNPASAYPARRWFEPQIFPGISTNGLYPRDNNKANSSTVSAVQNNIFQSYTYPSQNLFTPANMTSSFLFGHPLVTSSLMNSIPNRSGDLQSDNKTGMNLFANFSGATASAKTNRQNTVASDGSFHKPLQQCAR